MVGDECDEDLLMANCLGMTTTWLEDDAEEPYRQPDHVGDDLGALPPVLEKIESQ